MDKPAKTTKTDQASADRWNTRYQQTGDARPDAARVLQENRHLLPRRGRALDLACGLGGNALMLAEHGLDTCAWDISSVAIETLKALAMQRHLTLRCEVRDVVVYQPEPAAFDVIVVSRFLDRTLAPALQAALRPGGLLFYQTFTKIRVNNTGPDNPDFLLDDNELLDLFTDLKVRIYREECRIGDVTTGFRDMAMLVAQAN